MNLVGTLILFVLMSVVLFAPRRMALLGMMAGVLYLTQFEQIQVLGLNLFAVRFLELAGFIRVMARSEFSFRQMNGIDRALLLFYTYTTVVFLLRSTDGLAFQVGAAGDAFLCYFTFRGLVRDMGEFRWFLGAFVLLLAPYALMVAVESLTNYNVFSLIGGWSGHVMRHGMPRCYGSFRQADTLGMFAGSFLPLYVGLALGSRERKRALLAIFSCLIIVVASNSGGPIGGAGAGLVCWGFWRYRTKMRLVRWSLAAMIAGLALVMKAPIWYMLEHVGSVTGGDAWHRSYLMDVTWQHLGQWWLAGIPISKTAGWFAYDLSITGGADITNQFVAFGLTAGLGAIILFIVVLTRAYRAIGEALAAVRSDAPQSAGAELFLWGCGGTLTVHVADWFGITYFDQMYVVWFLQLAAIASITGAVLKRPEVEEADSLQFDEFCSREEQPTVQNLQGNKAIG